jgi:hypothetical protein
MNWLQRHDHELSGALTPEVASFVLHALRGLERENVFDAPGVISGVLRQMRMADSEAIRGAACGAERFLEAAFARKSRHRTEA